MGKRRHPDQPIIDPRKCPEHNVWKKAHRRGEPGVCELCRMRLDEIQKRNEQAGGSKKQPIKVIKL